MLELVELHKRYGPTPALHGLSLTARPGRVVGVAGPSGAGKTTALRAIFGLVRLDGGAVRWRQRPVQRAHARRFGYMPEGRGLYPRLATVAQLTYLARLGGLSTPAARRTAEGWLERLGLGEHGQDRVDQLSPDNQQRAQLAAALVKEPELLVLDEPFRGLDPLTAAAVSDLLRQQARDGAAVVLASHQLDLVEDLCDDVVIVAAGRERLAGTLDEVRHGAGYYHVHVRLAGAGGVTPPADTELIEATAGSTRLRASASLSPQALLEQLSAQGTVEAFAFGPPPLSQRLREVVGATAGAPGPSPVTPTGAGPSRGLARVARVPAP